MNNMKILPTTLAFLGALGMTACNDTGTDTGDKGISKTTTGVITGFGSVFVNGVEYETGGARIFLDGVERSENALALGMVVTLKGTVNADGTTGNATSIAFEEEVEGIVTAKDIGADGAGTLTVMGQTVQVSAETAFESKVQGIDSLADVTAEDKTNGIDGNVVEVSGFSDGSGSIYATRVEVKHAAYTAGQEIEVKGLVTNVTATTFQIGDLTIDISAAAQLEVMPEEGLYVEVKSTDGFNAAGQLIATKVELEGSGSSRFKVEEGETVEVEGVLIATGNGELKVNGVTIKVVDETPFDDGLSLGAIAQNTKVKVEGYIGADGTLIVEEIELKQPGDLKLEGRVEAVDVENGTITLMGEIIRVTATTTLEDERDNVRYFSIADLDAAQGDWVEVRAYRDSDGVLVATKLEREYAETKEDGEDGAGENNDDSA